MDINRLNEFIVLATHLNYSKAANQLFLTQPALSRHIHDLEQTLGARLFIRDTHNVHLTSVGQLFYHEAREIVDHYNHALELVKEATSSASGQVSIGFLGAAVQPFLSRFIPEFSAEHPQIKLSFSCDNLDVLTKRLNEDQIDLGFVTHVDRSFFSGLQSETLLKDRLVAVFSPDNPLASKDQLYLKELSGVPGIAFSRQSNPITYEFHQQLFKKANTKYNIVQEVPNIETALFFVSINKGFFIIPSHLEFMVEDLSLVPLADEGCNISLNLLWKKNNPNPSLPVFRKAFMSYMQNAKSRDSE